MTTDTAVEIRESARDIMRSSKSNGSLRSGCDLADAIRAHADPLAFLASLWDVCFVGDVSALHTLEKATKIISLGLRQPVALSATTFEGCR